MDAIALLLSTLIGIISPTGVVLDRVAETNLRKRLIAAEQLQVRIDNAPSYQILSGKVDRIRIAGKGLVPVKDFRIDTLEVESDRIFFQRNRFTLTKPAQAGIRLVLKPEDINRALESPLITTRLRNLAIRAFRRQARQIEQYDLINPKITLLPNGVVRLQIELREQGYPENLKILAEAKPKMLAGRILQAQDLKIFANGQPAPEPIVNAIAKGLSERFDLAQLEKSGMTARILNFKIEPSTLEVSAFVQMRSR
jgi:LmeA-like phospholipid-binding